MTGKDRVVAKYLRLSMTDELRKMVKSIPLVEVEEVHVGKDVYLGQGKLRTGLMEYPATVRVTLASPGRLEAAFESPKAGIRVVLPFENAEQRADFVRAAAAAAGQAVN